MNADGPRLAALKKGAQQVDLVYHNLGVLCEHIVFLCSFGQFGYSDCGLSDAPVFLCVQRTVVGYI